MPKSKSQLRVDQILTIIGLVLLLALIGFNQALTTKPLIPIASTMSLSLIKVADLPVSSSSVETQNISLNQVSAKAVYVYDLASGSVLYEKNAHQALLPASTTKIMTALVASKLYPNDQIFTINQEVLTEGNTMKLVRGEKITAQNLMTGLLVFSANDAAFAFASNHPDGYEGFLRQMNQTAKELSLEASQFQNPSGLDQPDHQTTARDLAIMAKKLLQNPQLAALVNTPQTMVTDVNGQYSHQLYNTNALLGKNGVKGIKTGTTDGAGQVLVSLVEQNGHQIIIVVMGSEDRYADTLAIIKQIFTDYVWESWTTLTT